MSINDYYLRPPYPVNIEEKLLPYGSPNRSGREQIPEYIVIHEVSLGIGKSPSSYNMDYYANKIFESSKNDDSIGYHFLVGDQKIYQFVKETECTDHTGTREGNQNSIGVERLICEGINYEYALHNQAKLIATLMVKWNIPITNVVTHRKIQKLFTPAIKNYKLYTENVRDVLTDDIKDDFYLEYQRVLEKNKEIFKRINNSNRDLLNNGPINNELIAWQEEYTKGKEQLNQFFSFSEQRQYVELYKMISWETKLNKIYCQINNLEYIPFEEEINGINFTEDIKAKDCPNRLVAGQRGGLVKFYKEIEKCLKNNILFTELLNETKQKELN